MEQMQCNICSDLSPRPTLAGVDHILGQQQIFTMKNTVCGNTGKIVAWGNFFQLLDLYLTDDFIISGSDKWFSWAYILVMQQVDGRDEV